MLYSGRLRPDFQKSSLPLLVLREDRRGRTNFSEITTAGGRVANQVRESTSRAIVSSYWSRFTDEITLSAEHLPHLLIARNQQTINDIDVELNRNNNRGRTEQRGLHLPSQLELLYWTARISELLNFAWASDSFPSVLVNMENAVLMRRREMRWRTDLSTALSITPIGVRSWSTRKWLPSPFIATSTPFTVVFSSIDIVTWTTVGYAWVGFENGSREIQQRKPWVAQGSQKILFSP